MTAEFGGPMSERLLDLGPARVVRYGRKWLLRPKNVAEHAFVVARNTRWLCIVLKSRGVTVDELVAVDIALVHDEEEEVTSDIVSPVKHEGGEDGDQNEAIERALETIASNAIRLLYGQMPPAIRDRALEMWERYKRQQCLESQVVKLADILAGMAECREELSLGNSTIEPDYKRYLALYQQAKTEYPWAREIADLLP